MPTLARPSVSRITRLTAPGPSAAATCSQPRVQPSRLASAAARSGCPEDIGRLTAATNSTTAWWGTALRGAAAYQLGWFDAHLWAYAEHYGLEKLWSEDFQHDRLYGTVRAVNLSGRADPAAASA
jgi:hypothetical protein